MSHKTLSTNSLWTKLKSIPSNTTQHPIEILFEKKSKSLIVTPYVFDINPKAENIIFKYSFSMNSWMTYKIETTHIKSLIPATIHQNKMYSICNLDEIAILDMDHTYQSYNNSTTCTMKFIENATSVITSIIPYTSYFMINDHFYCISNSHFSKYNINTKKHQILPHSSIRNWFGASLTQVKNNLILFGRIDHKTPSIQQYDISNNCWEILPVKLPTKINFISTTSILNEQMILTFATDIDRCFFIYEVKTRIFKKLNIKLPKYIRMCNQIFAMNDKKRDISIVNGWIANNSNNLPVALQLMISRYYINEFIHLMNPRTGDHYNIDVFHILNT